MTTGFMRWWTRRSLRLRLTATAGVVIAAGLAGAAVLLVGWLRMSLVSGLDQTALQRAQVVAAAADTGRLTASLPASAEGDAVVQVVDAKGAVRAGSGNVAGEARLFTFSPASSSTAASAPPAAPAPAASGDPQARTVRGLPLGDNGTWRAVAVPAGPAADPVTVYVAVPTATTDRGLAELSTGLAVGVPTVVAVLTGIAWLLIGRALRPVEALRAQTADITASDLGRRLAVPPAHDEVTRLARTLNDLLGRLDSATRQQRRFVADAAHELRSPMSSLHTQLEVAVLHPGLAPWPVLGPELLRDSERLSRLIDNLLQLARLDARPPLRRQVVDLDEIVFAEVRGARQHTDHVIDVAAVGAARVKGDGDALARTVRNLLDNAVRHAAGRIGIRLGVDGGTAVLVITDNGSGIPPEHRQRVFDRFTRLDDARTRDAGGSGLGLAIVHDIVTAHGGTVRIEDNAPGARVVVRLPAAGA